MIIKNLSWKRFYPKGLLEYVRDEDKMLEHEAPIYWNIPNPTFKGTLKAFRENHLYRNLRKNSAMMHHEILSFSPKDHHQLKPLIIRDLVYRYLENRATNNLAYAQIHADKGHLHVHIAISPNPYKERNVTHLNNEKYRQIRIDLENYQQEKYPQLENSLVFIKDDKSKAKGLSVKEFEMKKRGTVSIVEQLQNWTKGALQAATSRDDFDHLLLQHEGINFYKRSSGKVNGILYEGKKYSFHRLGINKEDLITLDQQEKSLVDDLLAMQRGRKRNKDRERGFER